MKLTFDARSLSTLSGLEQQDVSFLLSLTHTPHLEGVVFGADTSFADGLPSLSLETNALAVGEENEWESYYVAAIAASLSTGQHYFVTADRKLLRDRNLGGHSLRRPSARILSVDEATACAGVIMRIHGSTFWEATPNSTLAVSNFTLYSKLAVGALPNRIRFHRNWIKTSSRSDEDFRIASELEQSLHYRAAELFRARDHTGRENLRKHTAATVDSILYHLRAALAASAASFDSLAKLSAIALDVPAARRAVHTEIGFGLGGFRKTLAEFGGVDLAQAAGKAAPVFHVLKAFRDPMIHQAGLSGGPLHHVGAEKPSESRADITNVQRVALEGLGKRTGRPEEWGLRTWGDHSMIDPACFADKLAIETVSLLNELLGCLSDDLGLPNPPFDAIDEPMLRRLGRLAAVETVVS